MEGEKKATRIENYSIIELIHLSFMIRDALEYCSLSGNHNDEVFENRYRLVSNIIAEDKFIAKFLINNPSEQGKLFYENLKKFFNNIYVNGNYVDLATKKADPDKKIEFLTEIIKNEQTIFDLLQNFLSTLKDVVEEPIKNCIKASEEFFRMLFTFFVYEQVLLEDQEYRKTIVETKDPKSYECKFILNNLKELISIFNFNRQKYCYNDQLLIINFEETFKTFQILDRSIKVDSPEKIKEAVDNNRKVLITNVKRFEDIWKKSYGEVSKFIAEHPINMATTPETPKKPNA